MTIFTGLGVADCGVAFEVGKKYIIYGKNESDFGNYPKAINIFWTNKCMRTKDYHKDEIDEIEKYIKKK